MEFGRYVRSGSNKGLRDGPLSQIRFRRCKGTYGTYGHEGTEGTHDQLGVTVLVDPDDDNVQKSDDANDGYHRLHPSHIRATSAVWCGAVPERFIEPSTVPEARVSAAGGRTATR